MKDKKDNKIYPNLVAENLPNEYLIEISRIILKFNLLEFHLGRLIIAILKIPTKPGRVLIATMPASAKIKIICKFTNDSSWIKDDMLRKNIKLFINKVDKIVKKRNNFAHGLFGWDFDGPDVYYRYLFKENPDKNPIDAEELNLSDLQKLTIEINDLSVGAMNLMGKVSSSQ